ncbi:hypothetical protein D9615_005880 [Tricholomella constricta]|uniref:FAD/NAD(P)-binding domain-containing protein n=1 Tax=Tricholomella constricta TaxID=117010 RepID=A0A8H5H9N1_9AGAR|nr:hypothetical protein D9615_005880 [Tricholomella constricta]
MDLPMIRSDDGTKTICIIGAGPAGLAALKVVLESPQHKAGQWKATAFEARDRIGGVWLPAPPTDDPPLTPLYESLTTNLPHPIMAFTSYSFPPATPLFPHANLVHKYLDDYADHFLLRTHIQLNTTVTSVTRSPSNSNWHVTLSTGFTLPFDLVVVCNGHYRIPRYPNIPGIASWLTSGRATHSAWYRHPHNLGDTVLVVGAGPSGQDISAEMRTAARSVIHSVSGAPSEDTGNLKRRGRVTHFGSSDDGQVTFEDGSTESGINHCILATGYEVSFPFLAPDIICPEIPPPVPPLPRDVYNSTYGVFPLAKHIFPLQSAFPPSSLAFLGLLVRVAPFPIMEAQARAVLHAFADPESLEPMQEAVDIMSRYEELRDGVGDSPLAIAKAWHRFEPLQQFEYRDALYDFFKPAEGDLGPVWDDKESKGVESGRYTKVPQWEKEAYLNKDVLRKAWLRLEETGEAEKWVKGVGEGGLHEWIEMMQKLRTWAEEQEIDVKEADKARL